MGARVIAVDIVQEKVQMASVLGADGVINAKQKDPVREVKRLTEGRGADVAFEVVGLTETMLHAIDSVRRGGKIMDIGSLAEPISLRMSPSSDKGLSISKELSLMTVAHCSRADMAKLLELVAANKIDFDTGTATVPLDDIHKGFEMKAGGQYLRVLIAP